MVMLVNMLFLSLVTCGGRDIYRHDGPHAISKSITRHSMGMMIMEYYEASKIRVSPICGVLWKECNYIIACFIRQVDHYTVVCLLCKQGKK